MDPRFVALLGAALALPLGFSLSGCSSIQQTTSVGVSVATLVKMYGLVDLEHNCDDVGGAFAPDIQAWWNGRSPAEKKFPVVGFEAWRNDAFDCTTSRVDAYHALFTFDTASVNKLKGLVSKAELVISTHTLPASFLPSPAQYPAVSLAARHSLEALGRSNGSAQLPLERCRRFQVPAN